MNPTMKEDQKWKIAKPPNYETNKDKLYPYSELPDLSEYQVVKIPHCVKNLIEHVHYFGQGRISTDEGYLGFPDCYNVHYEYQLVTLGEDICRKIPNRIPIPNNSDWRSDYYTSNYIKDNSVRTVTLSPRDIDTADEVLKDIARIVNGYSGKVILYGYDINNREDYYTIVKISEELKKLKQLFYCPIYMLPDNLQLTYYKTCYRVYLSLYELKKELYSYVAKGEHEAAIILTGCLTDVYCCNALGEVVAELVENKVQNVIEYAYKLWINHSKNIVCKYFPTVFQLMFNSDGITIVNKKNNQALIIERSKDIAACGSYDKNSTNAKWNIIPIWDNDTIAFKLRNVDSDLYLNISTEIDTDNRVAYGVERDSAEITQEFNFEPLMIDGQVAFTITNSEYDGNLQISTDDSSENKAVLGGESNGQDEMWIFVPWKQMEANDGYKENIHGCSSDIVSI